MKVPSSFLEHQSGIIVRHNERWVFLGFTPTVRTARTKIAVMKIVERLFERGDGSWFA